ncbi:MAG: ATP-binding protein [Bacteroidales bacterium]|nr:ATP-binding protein [Bacteroidales bacterium]
MDKYQIQSGEFIAIEVLKISSIPHVSTLSENISTVEQNQIIVSYAQSMANSLTEIYQQYKEKYTRTGINPDMSLDLTWITEAVKNQPFRAKINLYISIRAINQNSSLAENNVSEIITLISSALDTDKYEYKKVELSSYYTSLIQTNMSNVQAIVKEERLEDLQNQYFPVCYTFDRFPTDYQDLSRIVSILIANPDCAVSFQLIPTYYTQEELVEINRSNQTLNTLSRGVTDHQVGNMSISAADKVSDLYRYYFDNKSRSLFTYNILIYGGGTSLMSVATRVLGQLNSTQNISPNLKFIEIPNTEALNNVEMLYSQPWVLNDYIMSKDRNMNIWNSGMVSNAVYRLPYIITSDEAANFFRLPIGSDKVNAGLDVNETGKSSKSYSQNLINAGDIKFGVLKSSSQNDSIGLTLKDLAKHMLVVGTPGSGKTTFSVGLLDRLWKEHRIPFLVIEPAKNEYRALVQSIPELQVFTPGKNFISPFVFNPFVPPKNVKLETYKSTLKTAFAAGVSMSSPLDKIFEDTINNCYSDFRWLDTYTVADKGRNFNIADFIKCFQDTFDEIGYTGDAKNIGRAGVVRLKSLVNLFDNYFSIPIEDLLTKPTIIELAAIENSDQKALIIALLLLSILAYVNANYVGEGGLRNFILLEEAHVLLDSSSSGGEGAANPAAIAQGLVKRMLAEIRSYGVGLAIADQSPRKVGIDIVALTDIKVAFRLVEAQDKQILADSTSMSDVQLARLAKLKPGEAFLFFNRLDEPEEILTPNYRLDNNISISLSDDGIKELSTYWKDKQDKLRPYPECQICPYCMASCDYNRRVLAKEVARRIFNNHIKSGAKDIEKVRFVFSRIQNLIISELNDEVFDRPLLSCVKVHLWRKIKYETSIAISDATIKKSLIKE